MTDVERHDIEATREWFTRNEGIPFERVVAELGLTIEEVANYQEPSRKNWLSPIGPKLTRLRLSGPPVCALPPIQRKRPADT